MPDVAEASALDLTSLRKRVEAATGADRELDARILATLLAKEPIVIVEQSPLNGTWCAYSLNHAGARRLWETPSPFRQLPGVTASLDAALALVERVLPGWSWSVRRSGFGNPAGAELWDPRRSPGGGNSHHGVNELGAAPIAILSALLAALSAQPLPDQPETTESKG